MGDTGRVLSVEMEAIILEGGDNILDGHAICILSF